ncbi:MAG TPA: peptidylprolyl isomerase [Kofleriaceae bacterium]|jgi:hypothetical protein|nr:peptidylprolyl isomerase [Kofleriaceae bacterium]
MRLSSRLPTALLLLAIAAAGCGPGSPGGPAMSGRVNDDAEPVGPDPLSNEIMKRDADTNHAVVKHIVIPAEQKDLALDVLRRVRAGEAIEPLMAKYSKDPGSAESGESYDVKPDSQLVFEFKRFGLRLRVGEAGMVKTQFGWHVMKRIE